ncbi:MAG: carbon-nitrogen hydrolase family protein [Opitutaceae bacterium]|jgi:predicted amidohydrolase
MIHAIVTHILKQTGPRQIWRRWAAATMLLGIMMTPVIAEVSPEAANARQAHLPRKVLLGTVVGGRIPSEATLETRLDKMDAMVEKMARQAASAYPSKGLDLVVLPEFLLMRNEEELSKKTVRLSEVLPRIAACAKRHHSYLIAPALLDESAESPKYSNAAVFVDREGGLLGIYRKAHPVALQNSDSLEDGTTPGHEFPVFDCDFGRVGIQICFDMMYAEGWQALAAKGADIVALASASPATAKPAMYALQHGYYVVSAVPRDHASVYSPLGIIEAEAQKPGEVLVHQIDLSYAILQWDPLLDDGKALAKKYGDKIGYRYYRTEDAGIFWSNDPKESIGAMLASFGVANVQSELARIQKLLEKARGGEELR